MFGLEIGLASLLVLCLVAVFAFEFINGFHDTANAVATVIYTNSLPARWAVLLSGFLNFLGVLTGGIGVAMSVVYLLPSDAIMDSNMAQSVAMILALLFTAIAWNLGTWYYGIPCSSSHTLIGSILGVGLAYSFMKGDISSMNWGKASEIGISLLVSPVVGFLLTFFLVYLLKQLVVSYGKRIEANILFTEPDKKTPPPFFIRALLVLTCSGVSFSHGSNDGQKGVGLVMLVLICFAPAYFALQNNNNPHIIHNDVVKVATIINTLDENKIKDQKNKKLLLDCREKITQTAVILTNSFAKSNIAENDRLVVRKNILMLNKLEKNIDSFEISKNDKSSLKKNIKAIKSHIEYAPMWVIMMISLALGIGTTIGWKRIVETIGEKIGKNHLTYAQGASSELVAASTITISTLISLPVSTTHILSSGIAGSMVAQGGINNLQSKTLKNILLAWVLTLPVCIVGAASLFFAIKQLLENIL